MDELEKKTSLFHDMNILWNLFFIKGFRCRDRSECIQAHQLPKPPYWLLLKAFNKDQRLGKEIESEPLLGREVRFRQF